MGSNGGAGYTHRPMDLRACAMWICRAAGATYREIGEAFGITYGRARSIVWSFDMHVRRRQASMLQKVTGTNHVRPNIEHAWQRRLRDSGSLNIDGRWSLDVEIPPEESEWQTRQRIRTQVRRACAAGAATRSKT